MSKNQERHRKSMVSHIRPVIAGIILLFACHADIRAQKGLDAISGWNYFHDAPNALYDFLSAQAYDLLEGRNTEVRKLATNAEWVRQQAHIRKTLAEMIGPWPEKTALNAKIIRRIEKHQYRVEHIVFESQPGLFVTSSLFLPKDLKRGAKPPVILYASGHSPSGYRGGYLKIILNLVKKGFVVFAWDPIGQGERLQYYDAETRRSIVGVGTREHAYMTPQIFLTGDSFSKYVIWDGIRAIDYLLTRPEIDPNRIGITGRSGGGFQSMYLSAFDDRIYASAPENHVSNNTRILQKQGPRDGEQNLFHMFARRIDHPDLLEVRAPKPTLVIATTNDLFNIDGTRETIKEVSSVYKALGKEEDLILVEDVAGHASTDANNEAMYAFFQKYLNNPGNPHDEEIEMLSREEQQVTTSGQVATSFDSETVFSLNKKKGERQAAALKSSWENGKLSQADVIEAARKHSGFRAPDMSDKPVMTGSLRRDGYRIEKFFVRGDGNYPIPYLLFIPDVESTKSVIYLHPSGKATEAGKEGEIAWFVKKGYTVLAPDLVGTGEVGPGSWGGGKYFNHATNTGLNFQVWHAAAFIGRSLTGIRAGDVVKLAGILKGRGADQILGVARQTLCPVLLHAAALSADIDAIALTGSMASFRAVVAERFYDPSLLETFVPGALQSYDLPYLAAALAPRKLIMINKAGTSDLPSEYQLVKNAYQKAGATDNFLWITGHEQKNPFALLITE